MHLVHETFGLVQLGTWPFGGQPKLTDMIKVRMPQGMTATYDSNMVSVAGVFRLRDLRRAGNLEPAFELDATHFGPAKTSY